jgi:hypothetical protein
MASSMSDWPYRDWSVTLAKMQLARPWQEDMRSSRKFYCLLDEQPTYLVPERLLLKASDNHEAKKLTVNPFCWFSGSDIPPLVVVACDPFLDKFLLECEIIWVGDPAIGIFTPFWIGPRYQRILLAMWRGELSTGDLPPNVRSVLSFAKVLISYDAIMKQRKEWTTTISCYIHNFEKGYAILRELIHPFHIGALRRYYRRLIREGEFQLGDTQSLRRYVAYNESVARFYHQQLAGTVSCVVGVPVKPSYVYVASYQSGAELPRHIDREQCEYTITLCVDHSPEPVNESAWPIYLETGEGTVAVFQGIGDALLFKGRQLPHYRNTLPVGFTSTSIFFHYVREDFTGPLQ